MDHLVYLHRGDATLSRRPRKLSLLAAVVVMFSRSRKRYERQAILVTSAALAQAEESCAADAPDRDARRTLARAQRDIGNEPEIPQEPECGVDASAPLLD